MALCEWKQPEYPVFRTSSFEIDLLRSPAPITKPHPINPLGHRSPAIVLADATVRDISCDVIQKTEGLYFRQKMSLLHHGGIHLAFKMSM